MLQNLHTHTNMCDGKNSPEEIIEKAIALGFDSLGFSAHSQTVFNTDWELKDLCGYVNKISSLKEKYKGIINIYLGAELDYFTAPNTFNIKFDYTIGSVHMCKVGDIQVDFDHTAEISQKHINETFGKDSAAYVKAYYDLVSDLANKIDFDIVGHFDLITKFSQKHPELFDADSNSYKKLALEALHAIREKKELFEVNTGAISRAHRTTPYPAPFILDEMKALKCKLVLTSDCHEASWLDCNFKEAKEYIKAHGFDTLYYLTEKGFKGEKI